MPGMVSCWKHCRSISLCPLAAENILQSSPICLSWRGHDSISDAPSNSGERGCPALLCGLGVVQLLQFQRSATQIFDTSGLPDSFAIVVEPKFWNHRHYRCVQVFPAVQIKQDTAGFVIAITGSEGHDAPMLSVQSTASRCGMSTYRTSLSASCAQRNREFMIRRCHKHRAHINQLDKTGWLFDMPLFVFDMPL